MRKYNLYQIDSFTKEKFAGNPAGVTGNANGSLGTYLIHHQLVKHNSTMFNFTAIQGEAVKRAGQIDVQVKIDKNKPIEVKIVGNAVIVFKTELFIRCIG